MENLSRAVVLTDEYGQERGTMNIVDAHTGKGSLHRAFSAFVFRNNGSELLIQQRSKQKMLFPLHWANTCCSHPMEGESITDAGERRLQEECGFTTGLQSIGAFVYRAEDPGRGVEYEHDTVLVGEVSGDIGVKPDPKEIEQLRWITLDELEKDMRKNIKNYGPWFPIALKMVLDARHAKR